ncbi:MAG TPA: PDZ domain-containing protein [Nitrospirales bacterium]|nr:PDZ domain-containing protein [Nitrospirales bacterium]
MRHLSSIISGVVLAGLLGSAAATAAPPVADKKSVALAPDKATERNNEVIAMAEKELGLIVGAVTEDIRKELNLRSAEGVAVFEIIGDSLAEAAGIKVGAVIAEINKKPVRNLDDFGRLLPEVLKEGNFTVGTWEPTNPENQGMGQQMNFHFVPKRVD